MLALVAACALTWTAAAAAFESNVPGHRIHEAITKEAAATAGWKGRPLRALVAAVQAPDLDETDLLSFRCGRLRFLAPKLSTYAAEHHFDRGPGVSDAEAFFAGVRYVQTQRASASVAVALDDDDEAIRCLGRALHALQDFFSHSSFVDLDDEDRAACLAALRDVAGSPPLALRITAYFPDDADPENPADREGYTHRAHAKDAPRKNQDAALRPRGAGSPSHFEMARAAAVRETAAFLGDFRAALPADIGRRLSGQ